MSNPKCKTCGGSGYIENEDHDPDDPLDNGDEAELEPEFVDCPDCCPKDAE
jgi:hypothetical protein